ncbi:DEAD-domain-containing protein [Piromyces finnis]|uniref:RNA helicase n=1 Tax=Piromyces finnis TaxID=1754191 RepID=A0A1Y1V8X6_9FUNG|nr:DEAD-domain-containing protein [Piromyces finnis]|eukprot:ORX49978.1 DEAD-domain-containing protein [Piromyces finnis]
MTNFSDLSLDSRLLRAISKLGYKEATLVQENTIPLALSGKDILAQARTGSGKTSAYCLPVIQKIILSKELLPSNSKERNNVRAIILVPTRELADQVHKHIKELTIYLPDITSINISSGEQSQINSLLSEKPDIIVVTPSRMLKQFELKNVELNEAFESFVIDEADLIVSFGYDEDLRKILNYLPNLYQSYLLSATVDADVNALKQIVLRNPAVLTLKDEEPESKLTQYYYRCTDKEKFLHVYFLFKLKVEPFGSHKTLIFVNDIDRCYRLKLFLEQFGIRSCVLNSELPVQSRIHAVEEFNRGMYNYLIATDEAGDIKGKSKTQNPKKNEKKKSGKKKSDNEYGVSRGIDFQNVKAVINFDFPESQTSYMHRVGRTARGVGNEGFSLSFINTDNKVNDQEEKVFKEVEEHFESVNQQLLPFEIDKNAIEGFRYRVEDGIRAVTRVAVREARIKELKSEIITSEKLKAHFEDNPKDLQALRHDKALHTARVQAHMKHVPDYLLPDSVDGEKIKSQAGPQKVYFKKQRYNPHRRNQKKKSNPLTSFSYMQ